MGEKASSRTGVSVLLAALLLAGCASGSATPEQACRRQGENDPQVRELVERAMDGHWLRSDYIGRLKYLEREATIRCLQSKGLAPAGGVEPVEKPDI